ncbi:MAG: carboxypeptidase regulatory-like domain-containing protein [Gemmatimonadales bacterium]|nr:carboxypeptidase regulatory-like domain-containing protein [Gemmatimonadales bacterium]
MRLLRIIMTAAVTLWVPGGGVAQSPAGLAVVRGRVIDSLVTGGPLAGAKVELLELARSTTTDARGVFRFDSVPAGSYLLAFSHPDLAAFGFTPPEQAIRVEAGVGQPIQLTTPAAATIYSRLCPGPREQETGVLLGTLREATSGRPLAGTIRGEWIVGILGVTGEMTRQPRQAAAEADSSGRFQLCGVPTDVAVAVWTASEGYEGGPIEVHLTGKEVGVRHLTLRVGAATPAGQGRVFGTITGDGRPIANAHIRVLGRDAFVESDAAGRFVLDSLPVGSHTLDARALGFTPFRRQVDVASGGGLSIDVALAPLAPELPELNVTVSAAAAAWNGFEARRLRGMAGHFITREQITRRGSLRVEDLLRTAPGIRVEQVGGSDYRIVALRSGSGLSQCQPAIFVDSFKIPLDPESGFSLPVSPHEVLGIEVHNSTSSAPPEYQLAGGSCGVILIWTLRGRS